MFRVLPLALLVLAFAFSAEPPEATLALPAGWTSGGADVAVEIRLPERGGILARFTVPPPAGDSISVPLPPPALALPLGTVFDVVVSPDGEPVSGAFRLEAGARGPRAAPVPAPDILQILSALAYPNPANPLTQDVTLAFTLNEPAEIEISVYDWSGASVGTVFRGSAPAGENQVRWAGQAEDGRRLANGVYLVRIVAVSGTRREPVVLRVALWNE